MPRFVAIVALVLFLKSFAPAAFGQNFSGDARKIGMGGVGDQRNIASQMIPERRAYRSFVVPLGLIQVVRNLDRFDPGNDEFDPVRLIEDLANPLHVTIGRGENDNGFVSALVNARLSRDLNTYRGFVPERQISAEGLASPRFGHTFGLKGSGSNEPSHGVYLGVGPHLAIQTEFEIDEQLRQIFGAESDTYLPNRTFLITDQSAGQAALGLTAGYRGRIGLGLGGANQRSDRNGIYVAGNYHYLRGFRYDAADVQVRFDTDSQGLVTLNPSTVPLVISHPYSSSGKGFAVDLGIGVVVNDWQFGFGSTGLANRIEWEDMRLERFTLQRLTDGGSFIEQNLPPASPTTRIELPKTYSGNVGYDNGSWAVQTDISHGFQGANFHGGIERRFGPIELRGGTRYSQDRWHAAGGAGLSITRGFAIDVAAFDTTANIERDRKVALAVSLRFNRAGDN